MSDIMGYLISIDIKEPKLSPDGTRIVYKKQHDEPIYIYNFNDSTDFLLTSPSGAYEPNWIENGTQIAYRNYDNGQLYLETVPSTGGEVTRFSLEPFIALFDMNWAPDSKSFLCAIDIDDQRNIWQISADGTERKCFNSDSTQDRYPIWFANGDSILFISEKEGNTQIMKMDKDGSHPYCVVDHFDYIYYPRLSNDQTKLIFYGCETWTNNGSFWIYNLQSDFLEQKINICQDCYYWGLVDWLPDNQSILFYDKSTGRNLATISVNDGNIIELTDRSESYYVEDISWFPDGSKILYSQYGDLFTIDNKAGCQPQLFLDDDYLDISNPSFSPNGKYLTFDSYYSIYLVEMDSLTIINITSQTHERLRNPTWSPDGKEIACIQEDGLGIYHLKGNQLEIVRSFKGSFYDIQWSNEIPELGSYILFRRPNSIYAIHTETGKETELVRSYLYSSYSCWSPDGMQIAYTDDNKIYIKTIFTLLEE